MDCFVAEFIIGPAEGRTRWLLAMTGSVISKHSAAQSEQRFKQRCCCKTFIGWRKDQRM
jgi:hypothetical protein